MQAARALAPPLPLRGHWSARTLASIELRSCGGCKIVILWPLFYLRLRLHRSFSINEWMQQPAARVNFFTWESKDTWLDISTAVINKELRNRYEGRVCRDVGSLCHWKLCYTKCNFLVNTPFLYGWLIWNVFFTYGENNSEDPLHQQIYSYISCTKNVLLLLWNFTGGNSGINWSHWSH